MDNVGSSIVPWLFLFTFIAVIAFGVMQWHKARKAQREHHRSVQAEVHGEPRATDRAPARDPQR
ncbi:MAG: hypothetical protein LH480_01785 [Rubrivivax sp.]|nr:hypothetical protein [Rubrivivax sp.]